MRHESKYGIGQQLFATKLFYKRAELLPKCEHCGQPRHDLYVRIVDDNEYSIVGVYFERNSETCYKIYTPCVIYRERIAESNLEAEFFLTKEEAQAYCDEQNAQDSKHDV